MHQCFMSSRERLPAGATQAGRRIVHWPSEPDATGSAGGVVRADALKKPVGDAARAADVLMPTSVPLVSMSGLPAIIESARILVSMTCSDPDGMMLVMMPSAIRATVFPAIMTTDSPSVGFCAETVMGVQTSGFPSAFVVVAADKKARPVSADWRDIATRT